MFSGSSHKKDQGVPRPRLELSGPILTTALERMVATCESTGGIERYVDALKLKSKIFTDAFGKDRSRTVSADDFTRIAGLMPTVRRRVGVFLDDETFPTLMGALTCLSGEGDADEKLSALCLSFPEDKHHRWVRDMGAEILHNTDPEVYPLMCRWVWDKKANAGVIREIWHGNVDHLTLDVEDGYETFLMLREELSQFLTDNGVFQDIMSYVDLLCAAVYAEYVAAQGGSYLKADFSAAEDPSKHMRRLLGLDGVKAKSNRKIPELINGHSEQIEPTQLLSGEQ